MPKVSQDELLRVLDSYILGVAVKEAFNFGVYQSISRSMAASALGFAQNRLLLEAILSMGMTEVAHLTMKIVLAFLVVKYPGLNTSKWTNQMWCGFVAERITTMMNHLRRVSQDENRWRQLMQRCTPQDVPAVTQLKQLMQDNLAQTPAAARGTEHPAALQDDSSEGAAHCDAAAVPEATTPAKAAAGHQLETPPVKGPPKLRKRKFSSTDWVALSASTDLLEEAAQMADEVLVAAGSGKLPSHSAKGQPSKPKKGQEQGQQPKCRAKAKVASGKEPCAKQPSTSEAQEPDAVDISAVARQRVSPCFGMMWLTFAAQQSYIQVVGSDAKRVLLIGCSDKQSKHHQLLIHELANWIMAKGKGPLVKAQVKAKRDLWLSQM